MKKEIIQYFIIYLLLTSFLYSNDKYRFGIGYNHFFNYSVNSTDITNKSDISNCYGINIGLQKKLNQQYIFDINTNINYLKSQGCHDIVEYDEYFRILSNSAKSHTNEYHIPIDFDISSKIVNLLSYGVGLSLCGTKRYSTYEFYLNDIKTDTKNFYEDSYILGIGLNSFIRFSYILKKSKNIDLFQELRYRYINKLLSYNHGHDLSDQKYIFSQLIITIGVEL